MQRLSFLNLQSYIQEKGFIVLGHCYKCDKVSYRSEEEAKIIAAEMCKKGKGHSYAYECPKGNGWHLTSMKPQSHNVLKFRRKGCLLYTSPSPRDMRRSRMPSSA